MTKTFWYILFLQEKIRRGWKLLINLTVSVSGRPLPKVRAENHPKCNRWFSTPNPPESCSILIIRNFNRHNHHQWTICWSVATDYYIWKLFSDILLISDQQPTVEVLHGCKHFDLKVSKHLLMSAQPYYPQHRHISYLLSLPLNVQNSKELLLFSCLTSSLPDVLTYGTDWKRLCLDGLA